MDTLRTGKGRGASGSIENKLQVSNAACGGYSILRTPVTASAHGRAQLHDESTITSYLSHTSDGKTERKGAVLRTQSRAKPSCLMERPA